MRDDDETAELSRRRFVQLSGIAGAGAILTGAGHNLAAAHPSGGPHPPGGPIPSTLCGDPNDTYDHLWNAVKYCNSGGTGCTAIRVNANDYVFAGSPFHQPNFITVPRERIKGIECPWIADSGRPNYWQDAWTWAQTAPTVVRTPVGLGINSADPGARQAEQLHIHMATVRSYSLQDLVNHDGMTSDGFAQWKMTRVAITGWNAQGQAKRIHGYRVAHVSSFGSVNLFEQLKNMVGQSEMHHQTLIVIPRPAGNGGYYIINSQATLTGPGSLTGSNTCDPLLLIQNG